VRGRGAQEGIARETYLPSGIGAAGEKDAIIENADGRTEQIINAGLF